MIKEKSNMACIKDLNMGIDDLVVIYRNTGEGGYFDKLVGKVKRLVIIIAMDYELSIPKSEMEDLISEGYMILLRVVENYDQYKGYKFSTLVRKYIRQHYDRLYDEATRQKRFNGIVPDSYERITEICKDGEDIKDNSFNNSFTADCEDFDRVEFTDFLDRINLSESERVIANVIMEGGSKGDCSKVLGIKPPSVTYYLRQLRKKFVLAGYAI